MRIKFDCYRFILRVLFTTLFIISPIIASADELSDLKEQLKIMEQEKLDQERRIEAQKKKIELLESQQLADQKKIKDLEEAKADKPKQKRSWKTSAKITYYYDTREYNTFAIGTSTTGLPWGLSIWGFTDLHGTQDEIQDSFDQTRFFMEYRLSQSIKPDWIGGVKGLGWQAEYNDSTGSSNEVVRFGLTYKHNIPSLTDKKGWLQWRAFPYETDGSGQQMSLIYNLPITERIWIGGFADLNLREGASDRWVIEPAIYYKINERFTFVTEYRYNGFEDASAAVDGEGVAFGISTQF